MSSSKSRPYSQLAFKPLEAEEQGEPVRGTIIAIHGYRQEPEAMLNLGTQIAPQSRLEAPIAPRGVYRSVQVIGRTWFGGTLDRPEVAIFGDSLAQLEMFIHDAQQRAGTDAPKPWLLGYEQGAVLALTISLIVPDLISGVMAIDGGLPQFTDPNLLPPEQADQPILLIGDSSREESAPSLEKAATTLKDLGRQVDVSVYNDAGTFPDEVRDALRSWLQQQSSD